jgi:hypothetical protein
MNTETQAETNMDEEGFFGDQPISFSAFADLNPWTIEYAFDDGSDTDPQSENFTVESDFNQE